MILRYQKQFKELEGSYGGFQPKPAVEVVIVLMKPLDKKGYLEQAKIMEKVSLGLMIVEYHFQMKVNIGEILMTLGGSNIGCMDIGIVLDDGKKRNVPNETRGWNNSWYGRDSKPVKHKSIEKKMTDLQYLKQVGLNQKRNEMIQEDDIGYTDISMGR